IAARALGVATEEDLRDWFRMRPADARPRIAELVEEKALAPVRVEGWAKPAYLARGAPRPRALEDVAALLAPFDPLVWSRPRAHRLFDFHYRIEIYTPAEQREHGYYVLPFLCGERLAARVDLKADRDARTLEVRGAHAEPGPSVAERLARELAAIAAWLGLDRVRVTTRRGPLARALSSCIPRAGG
ncbi:MAG TPA: crosslink repair DNA glycosylase YcaQ family protein, partial [Labilithrix sp.]